MTRIRKKPWIDPENERITPNGRRIDIVKKRKREKIWRDKHHKKREKIDLTKRYRYRYNLTIEGYNIMFIKQNGCCAICGVHQNNLKRKLSVDHDHSSGIVRGLLCTNCNSVLGLAKDDKNILQNSIKYLNTCQLNAL